MLITRTLNYQIFQVDYSILESNDWLNLLQKAGVSVSEGAERVIERHGRTPMSKGKKILAAVRPMDFGIQREISLDGFERKLDAHGFKRCDMGAGVLVSLKPPADLLGKIKISMPRERLSGPGYFWQGVGDAYAVFSIRFSDGVSLDIECQHASGMGSMTLYSSDWLIVTPPEQ